MNKNKSSDVASLRSYFLSDKRYLIPNAKRNAVVKRMIRRMERRNNKAQIFVEVE